MGIDGANGPVRMVQQLQKRDHSHARKKRRLSCTRFGNYVGVFSVLMFKLGHWLYDGSDLKISMHVFDRRRDPAGGRRTNFIFALEDFIDLAVIYILFLQITQDSR